MQERIIILALRIQWFITKVHKCFSNNNDFLRIVKERKRHSERLTQGMSLLYEAYRTQYVGFGYAFYGGASGTRTPDQPVMSRQL